MINFIINCSKSITRKLIIIMSTITAVVALMITYNFYTGYNITVRYMPLVDAAVKIRLEATAAHLWFEELFSKEKSKNIDKITDSLDSAVWYANAMIKGGTNEKGVFLPLKDKELIAKIHIVLQKLKKLQDFSYSSKIDKEFDAFFKEFVSQTGNIELEVQKIIASELQTYKITYYSTLIALIFFLFIISLLLTRYEKSLKELSMRDPLTNLYNRLHIENIFNLELQRAKRYKKTFAVIFIDIDHFKQVNDNFGHDIGDIVLIEIANVLNANIRNIDTLARWGGEEFIILCPETDLQSAEILAQKLRKDVESHDIKLVGLKTCSFGVSQFTKDDEQVKQVIKRADEALYEAKRSGRNKVVSK